MAREPYDSTAVAGSSLDISINSSYPSRSIKLGASPKSTLWNSRIVMNATLHCCLSSRRGGCSVECDAIAPPLSESSGSGSIPPHPHSICAPVRTARDARSSHQAPQGSWCAGTNSWKTCARREATTPRPLEQTRKDSSFAGTGREAVLNRLSS
jgi:hypothetical protein